MQIKEFRQKYPEYNDISDVDLAKKLHAKSYSDMKFDDFAAKFGVQQTFHGASAGMSFPYQGTPGVGLLPGERTFAGETGAAVARGALNVGKGVTGTLASFSASAPSGPYGGFFTASMKKDPVTESLNTATQNIQSAAEKFPRTWEGPGGWALNVVGETVPYMGAALAGGITAGPIGAAMVGFAVEGQNAADEHLAKHPGDYAGAEVNRVVVGSLNAAVEGLQIGRLMKFQKAGKYSIVAFKDLVKKKAYKELAKAGGQFTKEVLKTSLEEGLEEFAQEGVSVAVPALFHDDYPKKPDGSPDVWAIGERLGAAALGGAAAGGILGAGGAVTLAAPEMANPSVTRLEQFAEAVQASKDLGEIEKAQLITSAKELLPESHPARQQTTFPRGTVQVYRGKESGKVYPETPEGGQTRMEEVPAEAGTPARPAPEPGTKLTARKGYSYRAFDRADEATGKDVSVGRNTVEWFEGDPFLIEIEGKQGKAIPHHKGAARGDITGANVTTVYYLPDAMVEEAQEQYFGDSPDSELSKLKKQFPNANFVKLETIDGPEGIEYRVLQPAAPETGETRTRIVSTETGEELELDQELTAQATKEARPPTIFDIPEATQKSLDAAKKVSDILIELEPKRGEFKEKMEEKKHGVWAKVEGLVNQYVPELGHVMAQRRAMAEAKGLLREEIPGMKDRITADEREALQRAINESTWYNLGEKMNLTTTLHELFDFGVQPDKSSIQLFDKFFGTNVFAQVRQTAPSKWWKKIGWYAKEGLLEGLGGFKQLVTSFDMSAGGVQAAPMLFRHPGVWLKGTGVGYRAALSSRYTKFLELEMKSDPDYRRIVQDGGLPITEVGNIVSGEEMYRRGSWVQKIPGFGKGVAGSERAYVANLNYQRFAAAKKTLEAWEGEEQSYAKDRELMDHIGNLTGRGKGKPEGWFEKYMEVWSSAFWAPRLYKAVVDLPIDFIRLPHIRKTAAHDAVQTFVLMGLTTYLASLIPGVEREDDPRSSDFWKLKYGNTRYNPLGRYQQLIRVIAQMKTGETKSGTTGRIYEKDWLDTLTHFLRGKLGPGPGMAADIATGETFKGDALEWDEATITKYIAEHVTPLFAQDLVDAIRFQGLDSSTPFTVVLGAHGISTQTYGITPAQETAQYKNQIAHEYFGADWDTLGEEAQKMLRQVRPSIAEYERKAKFEREDVTFRGVMAQEELNAGNRIQGKLPKKVQKEFARLEVRVGEVKRYSGNGWYLNRDRYSQFQNELVKVLQPSLNKLVASKNWAGYRPETQRAILEDWIKDAKKYAWQKIKSQANAEDYARRKDVLNERAATAKAK